MAKYYLVHSRTPGSKNGLRLYQNEDGTWTPLGLERRRAEYRKATEGERGRKLVRGTIGIAGAGGAVASGVVGGVYAVKNKDQAFTPAKDNKPSQAEKIARSSNDIVESTKKMTDALKLEGKNYKPYVNDLSNAELEKMIKRLNLEKQYAELSEKDQQKGKDWLGTTLAVVGGLATLGMAGAAIVTAISAMKKKKEG